MSYPQYNGNVRCLIWREGYEDRMNGTQDVDEIYHLAVIPEWADHIANELNELDRLRVLEQAVLQWRIAIDIRSPNGAYDAEKRILALLPQLEGEK